MILFIDYEEAPDDIRLLEDLHVQGIEVLSSRVLVYSFTLNPLFLSLSSAHLFFTPIPHPLPPLRILSSLFSPSLSSNEYFRILCKNCNRKSFLVSNQRRSSITSAMSTSTKNLGITLSSLDGYVLLASPSSLLFLLFLSSPFLCCLSFSSSSYIFFHVFVGPPHPCL